VPNLLIRQEDGGVPHPRQRINEVFNLENEECTVYLKDRNKPKDKKVDDREEEWYDQAFGKERNLMTITCSYNPKNETARTGKVDLFVYIKYKIHPELEEEFPTRSCSKLCLISLL